MYSQELKQFAENVKHISARSLMHKKYADDIARLKQETNFLPQNSSIKHRLYFILNNTNTSPVCPVCNTNELKWRADKLCFKDYCSVKCMSNSDTIKNKKIQTLQKNYNVDHPFQSSIIKDRINTTVKQRYGVEHTSKSDIIKEKMARTNQERYGVTNPMQSAGILAKVQATNIQRYGVKSTLQATEVKAKIEHTNLLKYNAKTPFESKIIQNYIKTEECQLKRQQTMLERFGETHSSKSEVIQQKITQTNLLRYGVNHISQKHIPLDVLKLLNDNDWLTTQHHDNSRTLTNIGVELGINGTTISNYLKKHNIPILTKAQSQPERDIIELITQINPNLEIQTNVRNIIPPKELDIYIPDKNIAIEYCGLFWHNDTFVDKNYHYNKFIKCAEKNIRLITIFEDEWLYSTNIVKAKLCNILNISTQPTVYARKCKIVNVSTKEKMKFYNTYHIQGNGLGSLTYGLVNNNELVACMTFICKQNGVYELNRYATSCNVPGGFSKLLKYFIKMNPTYTEIVSFADQRWSVGKLYELNNFTLEHITPPIYEYIMNGVRVHRSSFTRTLLQKKYPDIFDPKLTEFQNTDNMGIFRIWNCGLQKYILRNQG